MTLWIVWTSCRHVLAWRVEAVTGAQAMRHIRETQRAHRGLVHRRLRFVPWEAARQNLRAQARKRDLVSIAG